MPPERSCSCGESFRTLTRLRLHQSDECPDREEVSLEDIEDEDEIAERIVAELLECEFCGEINDGVGDAQTDETDAGVSMTVEFGCKNCGGWNENTGILPYEGGETA